VAYELQEDETTVPGASEYNHRLDSLVGFCGDRGDGHQCSENGSIIIGDGDDAYEIIIANHHTQQLAGYLRVMVVVPLSKWLPALTVVAHATCNRFTTNWVRDQWNRTTAMAKRLISPRLGPFEGRGSDGDARRARLQEDDMSVLPSQPNRFGIDVPGFTMSARIEANGTITDIHAQDARHNLGKGYTHYDSSVRRLHPGQLASHEHVRTVFETFDYSEHGLARCHVDRDDRMNKEGPARACSIKVQACLRKLIVGPIADARLTQSQPQMQGSLEYLQMLSRYLVAFFGKKATFTERVKHASFVISFLRRWRAYMKNGAHVLNLTDNFLTHQTYRHLILSCFSLILKIMAHADRGSTYEFDVSRSGPNECETVFSGLGGFGKILSMARNYTFGQALESLGDHGTLELYKYLGDDPLHFGSRMHKADIDISLHEDQTLDDATTSEHPASWRAA
jgi:hypothetical protein